jgi:beta-glucanase (GH16 family)
MKPGIGAWFGVVFLLGCGGGGSSGTQTTTGGSAQLTGEPGAPSAASPDVLVAPTTPTDPVLAGWKLVWADEFNTDGLPDNAKWGYDTFRNSAGWYNNELQYYAKARLQNSSASKGVLSITAIKERLSSAPDFGSQNYTSARLITQGKFSFTYGFVEVRAKLPCSRGTWPAIWTLGDSLAAWPANGEIDIMEQKGISASDKFSVSGTLHMPAFFGGSGKGGSIAVPDACTTFHNYQLTWDADKIQIGVDGLIYSVYANPKDGKPATWPFDKPQYLLLNLAMGGDLGGAVPGGFVTDQMQVDYVRVYQR